MKIIYTCFKSKKYLFTIFVATTIFLGLIIAKYDILDMKTKHPKNGVALVLSGGGSKALAHVGVLTELEKLGVKPDIIIGVSSGAIVGSLYSSGMPISDIKNLLMSCKADDLLDYSILGLPTSLSTNRNLERFLEKNLQIKQFSKLHTPLVVTATNLKTGKQAVFDKGDIIPAVVASASFPGVFKPVIIGEDVYVDGGVSNNLPVPLALKDGYDKIIAVNIGYGVSNDTPENAISILLKSIEIIQENYDALAKERATIAIDIDLHDLSTFSEESNKIAYDRGVNEARKMALKIKKLIKV